ncbi:MAG TPA: DUF86 domain-containing protein [Firmicutes bacterium]|nr:DUF86 domain-containing protein [Bacillota bacterium]
MIDRDKVRDKISFLRRNLELLRELAKTPAQDFTESSAQFHAAVRLLQISIEAMIDISSHIVSRECLGVPKSYIEVFDLLARSGIIPSEFLDRVRPMVRFRNRAVHVYGEIDPNHVHEILQNDLGDFETFISLIVKHCFT